LGYLGVLCSNLSKESAIKTYIKILLFNRKIREEELKEKTEEQDLSENGLAR